MAKAKMKKIGVLTALIMVFALSLGVVTACSQGDYKVTFYDGETVITEKWVNSGEKIEEFTPEDVGYEKEGFAFDAWYATSDFTFDWSFDTEITENKNVYSSWYSTEPDTRQWTIAGESSAGGPSCAGIPRGSRSATPPPDLGTGTRSRRFPATTDVN